MIIDNWKYYNHAAITCCAPHSKKDVTLPIKDGSIWKLTSKDGKHPLLARWTTDFDCKEETSYWYIIKDGPFSMDEFNKKRQKYIRRTLERCVVRRIDQTECADEIYAVYKAAFMSYKNADNEVSETEFKERIKADGLEYWGAFSKETGILAGWMSCANHGDWTETISAKYHPDMLTAVRPSEAIHYYVLTHYLNELGQKYICSGTRNINHKTHVQDFKIQNWHFRRAYCHLHIVYNPRIKWIVKSIYPFRKMLRLLDFETHIHQINSLLRMEEIARENIKLIKLTPSSPNSI